MVISGPRCIRERKRLEMRERKYQVIQKFHEKEGWEIRWMCQVLKVSRAAYYKWLRRKPSERDKENEELTHAIQTIHNGNNGLFGYRKMTMVLNRNGREKRVNDKRVRRLMRLAGLSSEYRRKSRKTWKKSTPEATAENVLNRNFKAEKPNQKWCTDITEVAVPGSSEKLYISTIFDLYDRYPVAYEISSRNDTKLVNDTLRKALDNNPGGCEIFHSDRGFQYTRRAFNEMLGEHDIQQSMSRVSRCIDNGPMEGFQGQLKDICVVLYPGVKTAAEIKGALYKTFDYYINEYPQKRFKGKTAGEVRKAALEEGIVEDYPIQKNPAVMRFWEKIESKKALRAL